MRVSFIVPGSLKQEAMSKQKPPHSWLVGRGLVSEVPPQPEQSPGREGDWPF